MRNPRPGGSEEGVSVFLHLHLIFSQNIGNWEILVLFILRSEEQGPVEFAVRQPPYCNFVFVFGGKGDLVDFVGFVGCDNLLETGVELTFCRLLD